MSLTCANTVSPAGKAVEKAVINLIAGDDKDDDKDDKKGGIFSLFGGNKKDDDDDKDKGGFLSFGDDKEKDEDRGGFFSKLLDRDDDDDKPKRSGFKGLFSEQEGAGRSGDDEGEGAGGDGAKSVGVSDGGNDTLTLNKVRLLQQKQMILDGGKYWPPSNSSLRPLQVSGSKTIFHAGTGFSV